MGGGGGGGRGGVNGWVRPRYERHTLWSESDLAVNNRPHRALRLCTTVTDLLPPSLPRRREFARSSVQKGASTSTRPESEDLSAAAAATPRRHAGPDTVAKRRDPLRAMTLLVMLRAIVPRLVFAVHALACVWRVAVHTQHRLYWLLLLLVLLLPLELIVTLVLRKGKDYKWLSLAILLYLINVVPAIWLLEVRYFETKLNETCSNATTTITTNAAQLPVLREPLQFKTRLFIREAPDFAATSESGFASSGTDTEEFLFPSTKAPTGRPLARGPITSVPVTTSAGYSHTPMFTLFGEEPTHVAMTRWPEMSDSDYLGEEPRDGASVPEAPTTLPTPLSTPEDVGRRGRSGPNGKSRDGSYIISQVKQLESKVNSLLDSNEAWILCIHQMLLLLLIIGRWLLPTGTEVSREKLSQLLLEFIGTAGDILEFKTETMQDSVVRCNRPLFYCIMAVWTWSLMQFPLVIKVHQALPGSQEQAPARGWRTLVRVYSTDLWAIVISVFIQDGPFLVVRLLLLIHFGVLDQMQMLIFFTIKNVLVLMLQAYRLVVIYGDYRALCLSAPAAAPSPRGRQEGKSSGEVPSDARTLATDDSFTMTISASNSEKMRECP
ncbi:transmembrane protein 26 [Petromyzon marinus]|uniref:transmembrane protein 26 n=1 Tax=Petromyzon marinus TaxID=7757 RepID=UPI003F6E84FA